MVSELSSSAKSLATAREITDQRSFTCMLATDVVIKSVNSLERFLAARVLTGMWTDIRMSRKVSFNLRLEAENFFTTRK